MTQTEARPSVQARFALRCGGWTQERGICGHKLAVVSAEPAERDMAIEVKCPKCRHVNRFD